ncbi:MAG TPA: WGxxGxxG family protein [Chitinophagaceae bacterium]|nr:WGxxGxxG family protein [Chitinophagaceae bacterium]
MKKIKITFYSLVVLGAVMISNPVIAQTNDNRVQTGDVRDNDNDDNDTGKWGLAGLLGLLGLIGLKKNDNNRNIRTTDQRTTDPRNR